MNKQNFFYTIKINHSNFPALKNFELGICSEKKVFIKNIENILDKNISNKKDYQIHQYSDFEEILENSDGIYIDIKDAKTDIKKFEYTKRCINKHIAVILSTPFFHSVNKAKEIFLLAKRKRVFCTEVLAGRFLPQFEKIIETAKNGPESAELGDILQIAAGFSCTSVSESKSNSNLTYNSSSLYSLGIYPVSLIYKFLGIPNKIASAQEFNSHNFDYNTNAILKYYRNSQNLQNELLASFYCALKNSNDLLFDKFHYNISVLGTKNCLEFSDSFAPLDSFFQELDQIVNLIKKDQIINSHWTPEDTINVLNILQKIKDNSI
ncbi:MAG: Gfo/Idh/MocA family oxidoreductase [Bifidobacteriaceae bacterium]|jgi:predicted dehydrogenase|nr:Gfo/Idh/MocA family oxidoreductase [Bifidobacteriaceae bacterium]